MPEGILEVMHQLATDEDFRQQLMINPKETLAQRGLSPDVYDTLVRLVPVLVSVAAAGIVLDSEPLRSGPMVGWPRR
jgi:hypothetical protein